MADADQARFLVHQATHLFLTEPIHFQLLQMDKSMFVWVARLVVEKKKLAIPAATTVLGRDVSERSKNMARRLAIKHKQQFYVSLDVGEQDDLLNAFVEKKLMEMVKTATT
ncbi:hypothetical protein EC973_002911 [Apophysomyces ossiformis]|uniref:Uncharacterized protein n=1 Tax=Apophysomyces ossiformis TaxID=679940 RepID=A0A8H7BHR2_9FUNG|nr:hypothetical protein EC973_002911 [Apophysomyces ossiformis]